MTHDSLADIRSAIDDIDSRLVALIAERQRWVEAAGRAKRAEPIDAVRAPARVEAVIERVRARAIESGAAPEVVDATYRAMIAAFITLEENVHASAP